MYSNFNFLQNDWQGLAKIGEMAEYIYIKILILLFLN